MTSYKKGSFGSCPVCGRTDGYLNISCNHWFVCHEHKTKWFVGSSLFSDWQFETEIDWLGNAVLLGRYKDVEPIDTIQAIPASTGKEEVSYDDLQSVLDRRSILIVDDEPIVRESCERIFKEHGYNVDTAPSAKEGLERAMRGYFDCALIDLNMPDRDGMDVVRSARVKRRNMAVLIITGYGTEESAAEAKRLGVSDYLNKPFTPEELVNAVERALQGNQKNEKADATDTLLVPGNSNGSFLKER
jgi:CheY-like chemotaxis protein